MGKRLIQQRRGKGSIFRALKHHALAKPQMILQAAEIIDIVDDTLHNTPLLKLLQEDKTILYMLAAEGNKVGDMIELNKPTKGNVCELKYIPVGVQFFNIEITPTSDATIVRTPGSFATILNKEEGKGLVQLPSKKTKYFASNCRAIIGIAAGGGKEDKPFLKAGNKHFARAATRKLYPVVRGTAMDAYAHPHGGKNLGHPTTISRRKTPPGRKVGHLSAKRTGRSRKK